MLEIMDEVKVEVYFEFGGWIEPLSVLGKGVGRHLI